VVVVVAVYVKELIGFIGKYLNKYIKVCCWHCCGHDDVVC
jgi:hypothetical protein